jgi:hypothetical protein
MKLRTVFLSVAFLFAACGYEDSDLATRQSAMTSGGIAPIERPGNFVASDDDQVCYELNEIHGLEITSEVRGFKIDPPMSYSNGWVDFVLSADGKFLNWSSTNATVLGVIVKGGPNYNYYNYTGSGLSADGALRSPMQKKNTPQISHYNVCWQPTELPVGDEGCTPGYWRNHADRWAGAAPSDSFEATFGVMWLGSSYTLGQAIWATGGGAYALARHATAGLLNALGGVPNADGESVDYAYTAAEVIQMVQDAFDSGDFETNKDLLAAANETGCPLSGTSAQKAK